MGQLRVLVPRHSQEHSHIFGPYDFIPGRLPPVPQGVVSGCPLFGSVITVFSCRGSLVWASWEGANYILPYALSQQLSVPVTKPSTDLCPSLFQTSGLEIVWTLVGSGRHIWPVPLL